ncbi:DUF4344 domain-containing metallopeptidase [Pelagibacterium xiamenense]|uniref:DUF4344 domain-containing metallopeptidase n=1 Tax=Pelagibacterium xiamenense TaxID=2901140 RepID=UPI001E448948|nr:DUF4344 domain-containing metallopeptidase [Pelagibacterium xiamenense]MCD7060837.1 DUF4344 domain-containing metallopeptidase [Pelagibacterium xiamenense]
MRTVASLILAGLTGLASLGGGVAQELTNAQRNAAIEFTLNNSRHVLLHEIGHLFVDQLNLPVLGREEDAVDTMATLIILEEERDTAHAILADTVDGWLFSEKTRPVRGYTNADFYGMHSLDIQRSYAIACLMVGSDYDVYSSYATRIGMPIDRQKSCEEDHRVAEYGWRQVLTPHTRKDIFGADIVVEYRSDGRTYGEIASVLREARVLEEAADWITKNYVLPRPVRLTAEVCGEVNAFYVPDERRVILCYEWADSFYSMFIEEIMPLREHFAMMRDLKLEKLTTREEN